MLVDLEIDQAVMHEGEHRLLGIKAGAAEQAPDRDLPEGGKQFADVLRRHRSRSVTAAPTQPA